MWGWSTQVVLMITREEWEQSHQRLPKHQALHAHQQSVLITTYDEGGCFHHITVTGIEAQRSYTTFPRSSR